MKTDLEYIHVFMIDEKPIDPPPPCFVAALGACLGILPLNLRLSGMNARVPVDVLLCHGDTNF